MFPPGCNAPRACEDTVPSGTTGERKELSESYHLCRNLATLAQTNLPSLGNEDHHHHPRHADV